MYLVGGFALLGAFELGGQHLTPALELLLAGRLLVARRPLLVDLRLQRGQFGLERVARPLQLHHLLLQLLAPPQKQGKKTRSKNVVQSGHLKPISVAQFKENSVKSCGACEISEEIEAQYGGKIP